MSNKKDQTYSLSRNHYLAHLKKRFLFNNSRLNSGSEYFQHTTGGENRPVSRIEEKLFERAVSLKLSGKFYPAEKLLRSLLKKCYGNMPFRAECHYQMGQILQYLYPYSKEYLQHMVAARTLDERHCNAVQVAEDNYAPKKPGKVNGPRILLVLGSNAATIAFANSFVRKWPVVGIVQQYVNFPIVDVAFASGKNGLPFGLDAQENSLFPDEKVLGNQWNVLFLENKVPNVFIARKEANKQYVLDWVRNLKPDLIVSHGPERLDKKFIALAKHGGVNVHWGLSPTYRGMDTARWPLFQKKPEWVGVTIHKLDERLDTGPIIYQAKPKLCIGHTCRMIEYSLTMLACEIVPHVVGEIFSGKCKALLQEKDKGTQYWADQWTRKHHNLLTKEYIAEQIKIYHKYKEIKDKTAPLINPWLCKN